MTAFDQAARLLSPERPNAHVARLVGRSRSAVFSYRRGTRRPPVDVLARVQAELQARMRAIAALTGMGGEFRDLVVRRQNEPPMPLRGCCKRVLP